MRQHLLAKRACFLCWTVKRKPQHKISILMDVSPTHQLIAEERNKDSQAVRHRKEAVPDAVDTELPEDAAFMMRLRLELVSGIDFDADWLFCEYQVLLPAGYNPSWLGLALI